MRVNPEDNKVEIDYIKGSYLYFDWEVGWNQRMKSAFKFEFKHMENF